MKVPCLTAWEPDAAAPISVLTAMPMTAFQTTNANVWQEPLILKAVKPDIVKIRDLAAFAVSNNYDHR